MFCMLEYDVYVEFYVGSVMIFFVKMIKVKVEVLVDVNLDIVVTYMWFCDVMVKDFEWMCE